MTIDDLINELNRRRDLHGGSTEVEVTWESITRKIEPSSIYLSKPWKDGIPRLYIDADNNFYKAEYQHPDDKKNDRL